MQTYIRIDELAKKLNVPISWIYDRTRQGSTDPIPHYKMGKYLTFSEEEILKYVEEKKSN